jgi:hypothetical protein
MTLPTLLSAIVEALRSAGATEEIIAAGIKASGEFAIPHRRRARPRLYADGAARIRAQRRRDEIRDEIPVERPPDAGRRGRNLFRLVPIEAAAENSNQKRSRIPASEQFPRSPSGDWGWGEQWRARPFRNSSRKEAFAYQARKLTNLNATETKSKKTQ